MLRPIPQLVAALSLLGLVACGSQPISSTPGSAPGSAPGGASGGPATIAIDGSSTVFPITEAVAEEFQTGRNTRVTIGVSGTGGGMKKMCGGELAISGASRPIKPTEVALCKEHGIELIELPVAYDGISVVVNPQATWVDHLTVAELKTLWAPEAQDKVKTWQQVRAGWPAEEIHLFGPGVDSGTYDYFTKAIVGEEHSSRGDFTSSEDDNVLVVGVSNDRLGLGFFGLAYYEENRDKLKAVPIDDGKADNGDGSILPASETVANGTYQPLSRPIFIYVNKAQADRPEVIDFVHFYLREGRPLVSEVGYIPLSDVAYEQVKQRFDARTIGSLFEGHGSTVGATVEQLLAP